MDQSASYYLVAMKLGPVAFAAQYAHGFLVRRPTGPASPQRAAEIDERSESVGFDTTLYKTGRVAGPTVVEEHLDPSLLIAVAIEKRPGNPFPERIGVGRARNCDVALRYASISKLHAHFHLVDERVVRLTDNDSVNGTFVNGVRVGSSGADLAPGASIRFGVLTLEWMQAPALRSLLLKPR